MYSTVQGYVHKLNGSNPSEKSAKFIIIKTIESDSMPKKFVSINPYSGVPSYNPLIKYTATIHPSLYKPSTYDVVKIISCGRRFSKTGIPKRVLEEFLSMRLNSLPDFIKTYSDVTTSMQNGMQKSIVMDTCEPWFRGSSFYDMLRYFPERFLLNFTDEEITYRSEEHTSELQ